MPHQSMHQYFTQDHFQSYRAILYKFLQSNIFSFVTQQVLRLANITEPYNFRWHSNNFDVTEYEQSWGDIFDIVQDLSQPTISSKINDIIDNFYQEFPEISNANKRVAKIMCEAAYKDLTEQLYSDLSCYIKAVHQFHSSEYYEIESTVKFGYTQLPYILCHLEWFDSIDQYNDHLSEVGKISDVARFFHSQTINSIQIIIQKSQIPQNIYYFLKHTTIKKLPEKVFQNFHLESVHPQMKTYQFQVFKYFFNQIQLMCSLNIILNHVTIEPNNQPISDSDSEDSSDSSIEQDDLTTSEVL